MGEAKSRGSFEERREDAMGRMLDNAEVLIAVSEQEGGIHLSVLPRDEAPNGQSLAVILASWLNSNFEAVTRAAVQAKLQSEQAVTDVTPKDGGDLKAIAMRPVRSITTPEGGLAKGEAVLLGPDGRPLQ